MRVKLVNCLIFICVLLIYCLTVFPQSKCNLQISVYEFKQDGSSEQFPVRDAKIILIDTKTKKSLKVSKKTDTPIFENVSEGNYEITVSKTGFQKTFNDFIVDCGLANAENTVLKIVFLWEGDSNKTFEGYNKLRDLTGNFL